MSTQQMSVGLALCCALAALPADGSGQDRDGRARIFVAGEFAFDLDGVAVGSLSSVDGLYVATDEIVEHTGAGAFRLAGERLYAMTGATCPQCLVRVSQPGLVSSRVRLLDDRGQPSARGRPHIPLADLAQALGARVQPEPDRRSYRLTVERCDRCLLVLAPRKRE